MHRCEQEPELARAHEQPDGSQHAPRDIRPAHEEDEGDGDERESQCDEHERRRVAEAEVDRDEVDTPDHGDEHGEGEVSGSHSPTLQHHSMQHQFRIVHLIA